jgi:hypothetical protein
VTSEPTHDHVCLAYDDPATLEAHAQAFLTAGVAAGQRAWYVGPAGPPPGTSARHVRLDSAYTEGAAVDPQGQAEVFRSAFRDALDAGFTGLRVVADVTPLVRTAQQREAFCRYEHLIDRFMAAHRLSGMCAFRRGEVGDDELAELACLHPTANHPVPFRLHGCRPELGRATLTGELDMTTAGLLGTAMDRAGLRPEPGADVVLDAAGLRFLDHRTLFRLDRWAADNRTTLVLRGGTDIAARLVALLELQWVRVEDRR